LWKHVFSILTFNLQILVIFYLFHIFNLHAKCFKHWNFLIKFFVQVCEKNNQVLKKFTILGGNYCFYYIKQTIVKVISCGLFFLIIYISNDSGLCFSSCYNLCSKPITRILFVKLATTMNFKCKEEASSSQFIENWMKIN
jgi:hypothetical protein